MKAIKTFFLIILLLVVLLIIILIGYIVYLQTGYYRYEDNLDIQTLNPQSENLSKDGKYSVLTYNIGFGAYDQDYSFFMDTGVMKTGEAVSGKYGTGISYENVLFNTEKSIDESKNTDADFYLFQEVDVKATRSYQIDQSAMLKEALSDYSSNFASNFHSRFLFYPLTDPHGSVEAGLQSFSKFKVNQALRKSYTVDEGFLVKFFDLDRCYLVQRFDVDDKELVIVNNHMSAYDEGGKIRAKQLEELFDFIKKEYEKGNYVIVGGDFNHALSNSENLYESMQNLPDWVSIFPEEDLPEGFSVVSPTNMDTVATCRTADIPYEKGVNYTAVIDGFIVSNNLSFSSKIIDLDYLYSDHNPVMLEFEFN